MHGIDPEAVVAELNKLSPLPETYGGMSEYRGAQTPEAASPRLAAEPSRARSSSPTGPSPTSSAGRCSSATASWAWPRPACARAWPRCSRATGCTRASRWSRRRTSCEIKLYIIVEYGLNVAEVAGNVRSQVAYNVERMTGRPVDRPAHLRARGPAWRVVTGAALTVARARALARRRLRGPGGAQAGDQRSQRLPGARRRHGHQPGAHRAEAWSTPSAGCRRTCSERELCAAISQAALMGARGNSGVILSQIVRGAMEVLGQDGPRHSGRPGPGASATPPTRPIGPCAGRWKAPCSPCSARWPRPPPRRRCTSDRRGRSCDAVIAAGWKSVEKTPTLLQGPGRRRGGRRRRLRPGGAGRRSGRRPGRRRDPRSPRASTARRRRRPSPSEDEPRGGRATSPTAPASC